VRGSILIIILLKQMKLNWPAIISGVAILVASSIVSIGCAFAVVIARAREFGTEQMLATGSFFQVDAMLHGGSIGMLGLAVGYVVGPILAGYVSTRLASGAGRAHRLLFVVAVPLLWILGIMTSPEVQGFPVAIGFVCLGALMIFLGGGAALRKQEKAG
jgi:hypothetical protein